MERFRIALVADLHGNMPALETVWADIKARGVDEIWCLGDMVGKGPQPDEALDWARQNCRVVLMGNWDEGMISIQSDSIEWCAGKLGSERLEYIRRLPLEHRFKASGRNVRLLHGRPVVPTTIMSDDPVDKRASLFMADGYEPHIVGFADIHRQFTQRFSTGLLFNTGSVGNNLCGCPMAVYAIIEGSFGAYHAPFSIQHIELEYDTDKAASAAEASGMPRIAEFINEIRTGVYSR